MKPANPRILTINGGSSTTKFALFEAGDAQFPKTAACNSQCFARAVNEQFR